MSDLLKRLDNARRGLCTENPEEYMATGLTVADALQAAARIREQRELLEECERAFEFIAQGGCSCDECNRARDMLTKLRAAREKT